jgi:Rps23 Pro-64 3,4-dihydroxylase Tpa1-like proline 4-hydroxylase
MKTVFNFLDIDTIQMIQNEIADYKKVGVWGVSSNKWQPYLTNGILGQINIRDVSSTLRTIILNKLQPYLPSDRVEFDVMHYLWHPLSGINAHQDTGIGATIYMCEEWNTNWGGFLISADETGSLHTHHPHFNSLAINNTQEKHMVTTISPTAPYPRHTIQIFARNSSEQKQ